MSTAPLIFRSFKNASSLFLSAPLAFLIVQIPEVSVEAIYAFFPQIREAPIPLILAVLFPYLALVSFLSSALTFQLVQKHTLSQSLSMVLDRFKTLFPVALLTGVILLLGMVALILPFLYFMSIYLFVPFLVMTEGPLPWSVYLHKSKGVAKRHFWSCFFLVILMLAVSFGTDALSNEFVDAIPTAVLVTLKLVLSLVTSAMLGTWSAVFFLKIKEPTQ